MSEKKSNRGRVIHLLAALALTVGGIAFLVTNPFKLGPEAWVLLVVGLLDLGIWITELLLARRSDCLIAYERKAEERMQAAAERGTN